MKVAIIHYWLVGMRGGEKVLESLCRLYPQADIYTHIYDKEETSDLINSHNIQTTFISRLPRARKWYQNYLPFMPLALAQLDLSQYDLVISSESGPAKGVLTSPDTAHVCYCHSPMRYAWDMYAEYTKKLGFIKRFLAAPVMNFMRVCDVSTANSPDVVVANSNFISQRIKKCWGRDSLVVHPPVAVNDFTALPRNERKDFYLLFGEMVAYKRADIAIKAFTADGKRKLMVIGSGEEFADLKKIAGSNVTFLGRQPFEVIRHHLSSCRALIFPGLEDFGIVPVEALASGTPVIAYGRGGVLDTVKEGLTGVFFHEQTEEALLSALSRFEEHENEFDVGILRSEAARFAEENFTMQMSNIIEAALAQKR